jgi:glc operon protein GlcG
MLQVYTLSHDEAQIIVNAIREKAESSQKAAAIAVADAHGELIAFLRMDGCALPPITIAINKAFTAARERKETMALGQRQREEGFPMTNFGDLRYTAWGGGVPIIFHSQIIGGIGVSGLSEAEDVELARLGASLIQG